MHPSNVHQNSDFLRILVIKWTSSHLFALAFLSLMQKLIEIIVLLFWKDEYVKGNNNKKSAKGITLFLLINAIKSKKIECPFVSMGAGRIHILQGQAVCYARKENSIVIPSLEFF